MEFSWLMSFDSGAWFIICILLLILEALIPGAFCIWMSVAAGLMGTLKWLIPALTTQNQILMFSVLSIVSVVLWRAYLKHNPQKTEHPTLNRRVEHYRGRIFVLGTAVHQGHGKVQIDDSWWDVEGPDMPQGTQVVVVDVKDTTLKLKPFKEVSLQAQQD